jgi:hypothetical protein
MQSDKKGATKELQDDAYMRNFIDSLLKEGHSRSDTPQEGRRAREEGQLG